ncbi:MAG: GLPGLI family protein [Gelidibacter sp.]|nr:GLPGLI family protein [Gelidibacter sp.]
MNIKRLHIIFLLFVLIVFKGFSQINNAKISYKVKINTNIDSLYKINPERGKFFKMIFNEINTINMELVYINGVSIFKEIPSIFISKKQESFHKLAKTVARISDSFYTNLGDKTSSVYYNFEGVNILISSDFNYKWELSNEKKIVGDFECYKALTVYTYKDRKGNLKKVPIVAWYTSKLPIPLGPKNYVGLPGLILELEEGENTIVFYATKIQLDLKDIHEINFPKDVKIVTQEEFDKITKDSYNGFFNMN